MADNSYEVTQIDVSTVFDEHGDEMECRNKTLHSQGNVGKVFWVDVGNHKYTGIFEGGDAGLIRLSSTIKVVPPGVDAEAPFENLPGVMIPALAVKFLRDGVDSANTFGGHSLDGQNGYNFFEEEIASIIPPTTQEDSDWIPIGEHFSSETFLARMIGNSDFAGAKQDGTIVEDPVYPFKLIYEPAEDVQGMFSSEYAEPLVDQLQTIQPGTTLYKVYAEEYPGADKIEIAKLVLGSTLVTSLWGDEHLYFRHQRMDDDLNEHPEWLEPMGESDTPVKPQKPRVESVCPFAFLF